MFQLRRKSRRHRRRRPVQTFDAHTAVCAFIEFLERREMLAADLVATHFNVLNDHVHSGLTQAEFTVRNQGDTAAGAFKTQVIWSSNSILGDGDTTSDDVLVSGSEQTIQSLDAGAVSTATIDLTLDREKLFAHANASDPGGKAVNTVSTDVSYLFLVIDTEETVTEADESNNAGRGKLLDIEDITYFPWDRDGNGQVTPTEAVASIQAIGTVDAELDYNGNGLVTPTEAVGTIQRIGYLRNDGPYLFSPGLPDVELDEDAAGFTVDLAQHFAVIDDSELTYDITSSNQALAATTVQNATLNVSLALNEFGTSDITVTASNDQGVSVADTFRLTVNPVNDPPVIENPLGTISLTNAAPTRTIDLNSVFSDPEGAAMTYALVSHDAELVTPELDGSQLTLTGREQKTGSSSVVVKATDDADASTKLTINTFVNRNTSPPPETVQYAFASDQILDFHSQNTFILTTSFDDSSLISISSSNLDVVRPSDIQVSPLGNGQHRVIINHMTDDYGLAFVTFSVDGLVFSDIAAAVLPPDNDETVFTDTAFVHSSEVTDEGSLLLRRTFNDKYMVTRLSENAISPDRFFSLVRPTSAVETSVLHAITGGRLNHTIAESTSSGVTGSTAASSPFVRSSARSPTLYAGVSYVEAEVPTGQNAEFDPRAHATPQESWQEIFVENSAKEFLETYTPNSASGFANAVQLGGTIFVAAAAFGTPVGWFALGGLGLSAAAGVINAGFQTYLEVDPHHFDDDPNAYRNFANAVDTTTAILSWGSSLVGYAVAGPESTIAKYAPKVWGPAIQLVGSFSGHVGLFGLYDSFVGNAKTNDDLVERQQQHDQQYEEVAKLFNAVTTTAPEMTNSVESYTAAATQAYDADPESPYKEQSLITVDSINSQFKLSIEYVESQEREHKEAIDGDVPAEAVLVDPDEIPNDEEQELSTSEGIGENGDDQERVNEAIKKYFAETNPKLTSAVSVGKKLYDIAKVGQKIVSQVGELFDSSSSNEGDYTDNDGETYNLYVAQRGIHKRVGTAGRDVINTSYLNDQVEAKGGDDRINSQAGDDELYGGAGRNTYYAGAGNDLIVDGSGGSHISGGGGDDTIRAGAGNDLIDSGTGQDTIIFDGTDLGNNLVVDPSRSGKLQFSDLTLGQLSFRKDKYDLEIIAPSSDGRVSNTVRLVAFFEQDAAGWEVIDGQGNHYSLYELTGRITSYEALQVAFADRGAATHPVYPADVVHKSLVTSEGRDVRVHVAEDRRLIGVNSDITSPGLMLTFEGSSTLLGWLNRNQFGSLARATELLSTLIPALELEKYDRVTVVGIGEGGLVAQWFNAVAATKGPSFINAQLINTPDISGLISQVVRGDVIEPGEDEDVVLAEGFPEYVDGFRVLSTNYLVDYRDWIPQIGIWAGNDETYATWKAFTFEPDALADPPVVIDLDTLESLHHPQGAAADFADLDITDMQLSQVRGVVSLFDTEDFDRAFANIDVMLDGMDLDSTTNARIVLSNGDEITDTPDFDVDADTRADRIALLGMMSADSTAADPENPFLLQLDFQASEQLDEHLAPGHAPVTEDTIYNVDATGLRKYGWDSVDGLKAGKDKGKATSLERDSVKVQEGTFIVDLTGAGAGPGTYNVTITLGDREEIQESLQISINGYQSDRVSTMPGDFLTRTYQVNLLESELRISFEDLGGQHDYFSVNGISVEKVNYRSFIVPTETLDNDPSVVILTQSYDLPETSAGIEIFKEALKAAAMAALTAGAGAFLQAVSPGLGGSIATGLGGGFKAGAQAAALSKAGVTNAISSAIGSAATSAAGWSLVTSIPQNFVSDPTARGILSGATSIFFGVKGIHGANQPLKDAAGNVLKNSAGEIVDPRDVLGITKGALKTISGGLTIANSSAAALRGQVPNENTAPWIYEAVDSLATMSQRFRLGKLDTAFVPVDLDEVEAAIAAGKSPKQLLKLWQGSHAFLVLDWAPAKDSLVEINANDHLDYVNRSAKVLKKLLEAYVEHLEGAAPGAELDLLLISHGAGYEINRELVSRLDRSEISDAFDYVKLVTLDPIASSQKAFTWYHPEFTTIVDRVDNLYQTEEIKKTWYGTFRLDITIGAGDETALYQGGADIGALDGRAGGGTAGFYNRQARIFDLATTEELLRFRHWDTNTAQLSTAELTDIEFSPDGSLVAASGKDGIVTVRYVDDVPEPESEDGSLLHAAGDVKFIVWGQEAKVKSVAFMQMEVDGEWKDFLLTISAANNPDNNDIDKNKVLLTDVETGLPVWQGKDVAGTQVEASPSGNIIVSTDSRGHAKIWRRVDDTLTFMPDDTLINAHTGPNQDYIADVYVINDDYFVTAGLDSRMKLFRIKDDGAVKVQTEPFDNPAEGKVRNLDYDPYNGILAVAAGQTLSLWKFDQTFGKLTPLAPEGQTNPEKFTRHDHIADMQGVAFSKPKFLLDEDGQYHGDRQITKTDGTTVDLPRRDEGDIDFEQLPEFLADNGFQSENDIPVTLAGLKLLTGGEDRTLLLYSLDGLGVGSLREESVLSGSMLPIREVTISPDGRRVAVVGEDNIDDNIGGPVKDIDVTAALDDRLGWAFSELFLQGRREHNAVPQQYIIDVVEQMGESYFWRRNSSNANRPGDIDKAHNLALPPNKRNNLPGVDIAPIDIYLRPGQKIDIKPLRYLLEVDRQDYQVDEDTLITGDVLSYDSASDTTTVIGRIKQKKDHPNVFVFEASDTLDYTNAGKIEFAGTFTFDIKGPTDLEGNVRKIEDAEITFRIINHKPTAYRDIVELHPNRQVTDLRPRANDYDFDNDDFAIVPVPATWQTLSYKGEDVARYRRNTSDSRGVDIDVTVTEEKLTQILAAEVAAGETPPKSISIEFEYQVEESKYNAVSTGTVEVRLQLQAGPENVRYTELGADRVKIHWDPVSWNANKYVVQHYVDGDGWTNSDVVGGNDEPDWRRIKIAPDTDYWFRVVAKNTNTTPVREHASYEGDNKREALFVPATGYVGPASVETESLGPAKVEVRWEKVYWNVDRYRIDLHQVAVGDDGLPVREANGDYTYELDKSKFKVLDKGEGLTAVFKGLDTGTPYLAIVTAKNANGAVSESTTASSLVFTSERDIPAGISFERVGPQKARVSWATVSYAEKYRVVAMDPVSLARTTSDVIVADNSKNSNDVVLKRLSPESSYVVFVEAKSKRTGEWVTIIDDDPQTPILPNRDIAPEDISADLSAGVASAYILGNSFNHSVTIPSLEGLFVGAEFTLIDLSTSSVTVTAPDGTISLSGSTSATQNLPAAFAADGELVGAVVYRFVARESGSMPGTLVWEVQIGDELSEARVLTTPAFLAVEADSFMSDDEASLPRRPRVEWKTPFWSVTKHKIRIYEATLDDDGNPIQNEDGSYAYDSTKEVDDSAVRFVEPGDDPSRGHQFSGLTPDSYYVVQITTSGETTVAEEFLIQTLPQASPTFIDVRDKTLVSFEAVWQRVDWNVQKYRVVLNEVLENGTRVPIERSGFVVGPGNGPGESQLLIDGLRSGVTYEFTVEAYSAADDPATGMDVGWIPNPNVKTVSLASPSDLEITGLRLLAAYNKKLEVEWDPLAFPAKRLFVQIRQEDTTDYRDVEVLNVDNTSKVIDDLQLTTTYELRMKAIVEASDTPPAIIDATVPVDTTVPPQLTASTEWGIDSVVPAYTSVKVTVPRIADATHFEVRVFSDADLKQQVATSGKVTKDESGPNTIKVTGLSAGKEYHVAAFAFKQSEQLTHTSGQAFTTLQTEAPTANIVSGETGRHKFVVALGHPSTDDIDSLAVEISPDNGTTWYRAGKLVNDTVVRATDLIPTRKQFEVTHYKPLGVNTDFIRVKAGVAYLARVVATYPDGAQVPSQPTDKVTTTPLVAPVISSITPSYKSITISFTHSDAAGGLNHFKLRYTTDNPVVKGDATNWIAVSGTLSTGATSGVVNGLVPGVTYYVQVRAVYVERTEGSNYVNEFEAADVSDGPTTTLQIAPPTGISFDQIERGNVRVNWTHPNNSDFHSYNVRLSLDGGSTWRAVQNSNQASGTGLSKTKDSFVVSRYQKNDGSFTSLKAGTKYRVRVAAVYFNDNQKAYSHSSGHEVETAGFVSPHNLSVSEVGTDRLTVSWAHSDPLGGVDEFRVRLTTDDLSKVSPDTANWSIVIDNISKDATSKLVTNLSPGQKYYVQVRAIYGTSPLKSGDAVSGPHQTESVSPPGNVTLARANWRQLTVAWTPPGGSFDGYVVRLYDADTNKVADTRTPDKSSTQVNIGNLAIGQAYYAIVVSKTNGIETPSTQSATVSTYARESPTGFSVRQEDNRLYFTWNHFAASGSNLVYRIERLGSQGNWNTVKGLIDPETGTSLQAFDILRKNSNATLNRGQEYVFRVVAKYSDVNQLLSNEITFRVQ